VKVKLPAIGPGVEAPPLLAAVLLVDLVVATGVLLAAGVALATGADSPVPLPRAEAAWTAGFALLVVLADLAAGRLSPAGLAWRRRLGYLAIGAAVWRGGILHEHRTAAALVTLYMGVVWVALVTGGRALSRAIASATGEDKPE
jgi:hypothetical protein